MNNILQVSNLSKTYPPVKGGRPITAVDSIGFSVHKGEVFGFLGPNGAGKTTTIRMLTGLVRPSTGEVSILGMSLFSHLSQIKKHLGVVPDQSNLYDELTAFDNLVFDMQLYGVNRAEWTSRAENLLERFGLIEKRNTPFAKLSRGMKRALTIAAALAHNPTMIFLDEPTTGLDVMSARKLRKMIAGLREEGVTVFLTTHYLEEAEKLCDRIALIVRGKIITTDSVEGLKKQVQSADTRIEMVWKDHLGKHQTVCIENENVEKATRMAMDQAKDGEILSINTLQPTLEEAFIKLTGLDNEIMLSEKGSGKG